MEWVIAVIVVAALGVAAMAAAGGMGEMSKDPVRDTYRQDLPERPLTGADLQTLRFGVTLRGYAMSQVDEILDRLGAEIADRDALIAELRGATAAAEGAELVDAVEPPAQAQESVEQLPSSSEPERHQPERH